MLVFEERGKPEFPEKTSRSRVENQQTQPTYDVGSGNRIRDTLVEGERSHHYTNPAPLIFYHALHWTHAKRFENMNKKKRVTSIRLLHCKILHWYLFNVFKVQIGAPKLFYKKWNSLS